MRPSLIRWFRQIFSYPQQSLSFTPEDYDAYWRMRRPNGSSLSAWQKVRADIIAHLMKSGDSAIFIADIGCGDGALLAELLRLIPNARGIGYDGSAHARELTRSIGVNDVRSLELTTDPDLTTVEPADYFLFLETLEHIPESERTLAAAYAKARKGVFFSFPNTGFITYRLRLLFGKFPAQWIRMPGEHLRFWTLHDLRWWLTALGYRGAIIQPYGGIPLLNRLWPNLFAEGIVTKLTK